jgi:putative transposase
MARALRIQFPGAFYHITCRGIERRKIFADDGDRNRFLVLLSKSLEVYQVVLHAYMMMNNHFHLLIETKKGNCSNFMRHFNIRYTSWFNWRHQRCGNLYQGRYKAFLVDADSYLMEVSRYLHLNNVRVRKVRSLSLRERWQQARTYPWSSLPGYINEKKVVRYIDYDKILHMVGGRESYRDLIMDGLKRGLNCPFKKVRNQIVLGDEDFIVKVQRFLKQPSAREQPAYRDMIQTTLEPDEVMGVITRQCGINEGILQQRYRHGIIRAIVADILYKYCDITQAQIGCLLGDIDYMSVSLLRKRLKLKMTRDAAVRKQYAAVEAVIKRLM